MKTFEIKVLGLEEMDAATNSYITGGTLKEWVIEKAAEWLLDITIESFEDGTQGSWYKTMIGNNPYYCPLR